MTNTVLITGTSSGYGKAMADLFLERGWNVLATMRRPDASLFATDSKRLKILRLDVTDPVLCLKLFKSNRDAGLILFAAMILDAAARHGFLF